METLENRTAIAPKVQNLQGVQIPEHANQPCVFLTAHRIHKDRSCFPDGRKREASPEPAFLFVVPQSFAMVSEHCLGKTPENGCSRVRGRVDP